MASSLLDPLRPKPFRGDVIAAGAVVLTTLVWVVRVRFADAWGDEAQLAWAAVPWAFVTLLAILAPMERAAPRAYQSVLYVASFALGLALIASLSEVLGATGGALSTQGTATWTTAALAAFAFGFAIERNSAVMTLLGSLSGGVAVISGVAWAFSPGDLGTYRYVLLALMVVFGVAAVGQRDRRPRHGVALIDAAGLATLVLALSFVPLARLLTGLGGAPTDTFATGSEYTATFEVTGISDLGAAAGWGWELLIVAAGFGLIAYSSVDRQPGPAYLGVLNLVVFALITSLGVSREGATLLGWPLALALAAAALLAIGLRPTTPAPPPPDADAPEPPPLPLLR